MESSISNSFLYRTPINTAANKYIVTTAILKDLHSKLDSPQLASCEKITMTAFKGDNSQKYLPNASKEHSDNKVNHE